MFFNMLTKDEIKCLVETRPDKAVERLHSYQQRMNILLEMLNEMNQEMLQVRLKELSEKERS